MDKIHEIHIPNKADCITHEPGPTSPVRRTWKALSVLREAHDIGKPKKNDTKRVRWTDKRTSPNVPALRSWKKHSDQLRELGRAKKELRDLRIHIEKLESEKELLEITLVALDARTVFL